ncbi:GNAT family N-acetyltransferase [Candidatus Sneabacter namystus]|uniref:GNAT family N-acetyltransferase n=1 Tax=Candidatus Sneabacter namystus TaxID=2601646 RepID=A0A5C0UJM6_9RICK|nr:GNAT family protein [Candidatus Sneabacter namystus]QEK39682.1 GNAT family N-acetyltransferase [Candidatus Sneabacter namystus]
MDAAKDVFSRGNVPFYEEEKFFLRDLRDNDALSYLRYMTNDEVMKYLPTYLIPESLAASHSTLSYLRDLFLKKKGCTWGISLKDTDKLIGTIGFSYISFINRIGIVHFDLDKSLWGQGFIRTAFKHVLEFAHQMELVRVQASVVSGNDRAIKILEKFGFEKEGTHRKSELVQGEHKDSHTYAIILN